MKSIIVFFLSLTLINVVSADYVSKERFISSFCKNIEKIIYNENFQTAIKNICINNCYRYYKRDHQFCEELVEIKANNLINYIINDYCKENHSYFPQITCYLNGIDDFNY